MQPKLINFSVNGKSIGLLFLLISMICLGACYPKHSSYSNFVHIKDSEWVKKQACEFVPIYTDSASLIDVKIAFCYEHKYPFRNISLVVDFVKNDSIVKRVETDFDLTDASGNKLTSGFGVAYQADRIIAQSVNVVDFDKIRVWHGLENDTLNYITSVGVIITPCE